MSPDYSDRIFLSNVAQARKLAETILAMCDDHFDAMPGEITGDQLGSISDVVHHLKKAVASGHEIA